MPLDALCLAAVRTELAGQIEGMKIDKVQQPERDVIILSLRGVGSQAHRLLISVGSGDTRVHLTEHKFDNPKAPPMFCMLLRKHLVGARIMEITQPPAERVLTFVLETSGAMGVKSVKSLIIEMIGHQSNVILLDSDGIILDCLRRVGGELDGKRSVLPGLIYRTVPVQEGKLNPHSMSEAELTELINKTCTALRTNEPGSTAAAIGDKTIDKWLLSVFSGFSPLICREITWRAYGDTDFRMGDIRDGGAALREAFLTLFRQANSGKYEPWLISSEENKPQDFSFTRIKQYENKLKTRCEESFSVMLDGFYTRSAQERRVNQRSAATLKAMTTARDRLIRKLTAQKAELEETTKREYLRECGDIITANLHLMKKGQQVLVAVDFYSESGGMREIKLDPLKAPQQNAAKYYKAYTKAKNAGKFLAGQIEGGEKELEYVESVIEQIKRVENEQDLNDIRSELMHTGYVKQLKQERYQKVQKGARQKRSKASPAKPAESAPMRFLSTGGMRIFAGRNNMQNDKLTLKTAARSDVWFHAQKIHGAHVIVSCAGASIDDETLKEAAAIAAYYSAARASGKVPVDYTFARNVKKPSGGRPGMVIYNDFKTILAVPDEELLKQLRDG
jgi:predicted ribosome quality control (RQC) complex YloA/Tae2 family protein